MKYYTGFNAIFLNDDDFIKGIATFRKEFFVENIKYILLYRTDYRMIVIIKRKGVQQIEHSVTTYMMDNVYGDGVEMACRRVIDFEFPDVVG